MTKEPNLETVNRALGIEVRKLQEELKAADKEMLRLRAGGCARDQGLTQYCAEAETLAREVDRLRAALREIAEENIGNTAAISVYIARAALEADND